MSRAAQVAFAFLALSGLLSPAFAGPAPLPEQITFQGRLTDASGNPVNNGALSMTFTIYDAASGGTNLWTETQTAVAVSSGLYHVNLGAVNAFPPDLVGGGGGGRWLGVAVGSDPEMTPRYALRSAVYARRALAATLADTATIANTANTSTSATTASNALLLGGISANSFWQLGGNAFGATGVLGTNDNYALELKVNNNRALRLEPDATSPNVIGGNAANTVTSGVVGAAIGGGGNATEPNLVTDDGGAVAGGSRNQAGDDAGTTSDKSYATVGGGYGNTASGASSTVPGGRGARALRYGEMAYASGSFSTSGDAQTSVFTLRNSTTGVTTAPLYLDGVSECLTIPTDNTMAFDGLVVARTGTGSAAVFRFQGGIKNVGGTVSLIGSPVVTLMSSDAGFSPTFPAVAADNTNKSLVIRVSGLAGQAIRWVASVRTVEVGY